jgi:hypothetical protein
MDSRFSSVPIVEDDNESRDSLIEIEEQPKQNLEELDLEIKEATRVLTNLQDKYNSAAGRPYSQESSLIRSSYRVQPDAAQTITSVSDR